MTVEGHVNVGGQCGRRARGCGVRMDADGGRGRGRARGVNVLAPPRLGASAGTHGLSHVESTVTLRAHQDATCGLEPGLSRPPTLTPHIPIPWRTSTMQKN